MAARILGCSVRSVQRFCDEGVLIQGKEWRKVPGLGQAGKSYQIKRAAALRLREGTCVRGP
jgi:hypothetical protein